MRAVPSDSADRSVTGILIEHDIGRPQAQRLAADLNLPLLDANRADPASSPGGGILVVTASGLELRSDMGTLRVDYQAGPQARRVAQGSGRKEPLSRALGLQARLPTRTVFDATAGLCRDAFLLASLGVEVHAVERNPVVGALVRDALSRATQFQDADHPLANLQVQIGDARNILEQMPRDSRPEAIYLDPMFPPRRKSSLVKKEMRILAELAGGATSETELADLLEVAMHAALRRVVLKRPTEAPPTSAVREPDHSIQGGRTTRYDVWMT
jgi:16S rRNA (guanine1516-N2)-methyltransferase